MITSLRYCAHAPTFQKYTSGRNLRTIFQHFEELFLNGGGGGCELNYNIKICSFQFHTRKRKFLFCLLSLTFASKNLSTPDTSILNKFPDQTLRFNSINSRNKLQTTAITFKTTFFK